MRGAGMILGVALAVFGAAVPAFGSPYLMGVVFQVAMWIALAQSWSMLSATTGYLSLGHAVFYGVGAYVCVLLTGTIPFELALLAAAAAAALFAALVGMPVLRVRGPYFVILTYGLSELVRHVVMRIESALGSFGRMIFDVPATEVLLWWMVGLAVLATLGAYAIRHSRFGAGLAAIREDEVAAETVGVPVTRLKLLAFIASAAIPGAVGGLALLRTSYFEPAQAFDPVISFTIVTMALVGGTETVRGPILGAVGFALLSELLWSSLPQLYMIVLGVTLIAFILFVPRGLSGLVGRIGRAG
ncbi:branched-chain amino acid ABC transporter permease [Roseivivax isoporae]|uniref:ABC transporter ATP-binding protein n=1 Tax=Roseivivax isoporae LMG 25204 TaxID=1449351 RepID=X7F8Y6_9RHOB|nr:branched-chain amino acid ABC transporter permease [Roseivivax isoporae]ETX29193.1 ABC transporter ATP-binding protein [Roseivivax isoporae LMG 25204]